MNSPSDKIFPSFRSFSSPGFNSSQSPIPGPDLALMNVTSGTLILNTYHETNKFRRSRAQGRHQYFPFPSSTSCNTLLSDRDSNGLGIVPLKPYSWRFAKTESSEYPLETIAFTSGSISSNLFNRFFAAHSAGNGQIQNDGIIRLFSFFGFLVHLNRFSTVLCKF